MRELWATGDGLDDRVVYQGPTVWIGRFRCPRDDRRFGPWAEIDGHCLVFPRTSVFIEHEGHDAMVADPNHVMLYNRGQVYRRTAISERGDLCEWFAVDPHVLVDAITPIDPSVVDRPESPLPVARGSCSKESYAAQRMVYRHACSGGEIDQMLVEETVYLLVSDVVGHSLAGSRGSIERESDRRIEDVARVINERYEERLTLEMIADAVGLSAFHLCRQYKKRMGITIHRYLNRVRLRTSLERLSEAGCDLTRVALSLGFSSHSHFTDCFRREFGLTPSAFRDGEPHDLARARHVLGS